MPTDNPAYILSLLDEKLDHSVELTLIGKSALWLGFDDAPKAFAATMDVDGVIPFRISEQLDRDLSFWDALGAMNAELEPLGLYLTHLFEEKQIFLRESWHANRVRLRRPVVKKLVLFRPATLDLILTKMMRGGDPEDLNDIAWMIKCDHLTRAQLEEAIAQAVIPNEPEFVELFERATPLVLNLAGA